MKKTIYSDLHLGAPHAMDVDLKKAHTANTILTGDIYDVKNCKKKDLEKIKKERDDIKRLYGRRYIGGNHECEKRAYYYKENNVLYCHGHTLKWSDKKVAKWENKKGGMNRFKYLIYRLTHAVKLSKEYTPSKKLQQKCFELCSQYNCDTIVFGHTHRKCDIRTGPEFGNIRIVNVGRGKTIIDV